MKRRKRDEPAKPQVKNDDASSKVIRDLSRRKGVEPPARSRRRWILIVVALAVLGGLAGLGWLRVAREDTEETHIELMGNIDVRQVNLAFKVDGRIDTLAVDEGDAVKPET